jgi:hypothetical protein
MFDDDEVNVQGLSWCLHEPKKIGLSSLVKNVLCTNHNSQLSPVDEAGISARNNFKEGFRLYNARSNALVQRWSKSTFEVDGINLERWFLKTLITLGFGGAFPVSAQSQDSRTPHQRLVEVRFGVTQFQPKAGLYMFGEVGRKFNVEDKLTIITFRDVKDTFIAGATFFVYGFEFILFLDESGLHPQNVNFVRKDGVKEQRNNPVHRPQNMNFQIGKHVSHTIKFSW